MLSPFTVIGKYFSVLLSTPVKINSVRWLSGHLGIPVRDVNRKPCPKIGKAAVQRSRDSGRSWLRRGGMQATLLHTWLLRGEGAAYVPWVPWLLRRSSNSCTRRRLHAWGCAGCVLLCGSPPWLSKPIYNRVRSFVASQGCLTRPIHCPDLQA